MRVRPTLSDKTISSPLQPPKYMAILKSHDKSSSRMLTGHSNVRRKLGKGVFVTSEAHDQVLHGEEEW